MVIQVFRLAGGAVGDAIGRAVSDAIGRAVSDAIGRAVSDAIGGAIADTVIGDTAISDIVTDADILHRPAIMLGPQEAG